MALKNRFIFAIFISTIGMYFQPAGAHVGGMDGGGGQGILCTLENGMRSLESLDLYEARNLWQYNITTTGTIDDEAKRVFQNFTVYNDTDVFSRKFHPPLNEHEDFRRLTKMVQNFESALVSLPKGMHMNVSSDMGRLILAPPANCQIVQVLYWTEDLRGPVRIMADSEYWDLLSPQSKMAFFLHEWTYFNLRIFGETDSRRTRKIVGLLFDSEGFPGRYSPVYGDTDPLYCKVSSPNKVADPQIEFFVVPHQTEKGANNARLVFTSLAAHPRENEIQTATIADSSWHYEEWVSGYFNKTDRTGTLGRDLSTVSDLDPSLILRLDVTDPKCRKDHRKCQPSLKMLDENRNWVGGPVRCQFSSKF